MPSDLGPTVLVTMFTLSSVSTVLVALRLYCRSFVIRAVTADDWLILFALLNVWGLVVTNYFQVYYGTGKHIGELLSDYDTILVPTLKLWYFYQLQYIVVLYAIKLSILCFYRRLSHKKGYQIVIWAVGAVVTAYSIAMLFVNAFECPKDVKKAWSPTFPEGCNNLVVVYYAMASWNIFSDIVILILPLRTVMQLQINKRKRVALLMVFSCGSVAVAASIVRINALYKYQNAAQKTGDVPYSAAYILLWSQIEINAAVSSASAPALKPLLRSVLGGSTFGKSSYGAADRYYARSGQSARRSRRSMGAQSQKNGMIPLNAYRGHIEAVPVPMSPARVYSQYGSRGRRHSSAGESGVAIVEAGSKEGEGAGIVRTTDVRVETEINFEGGRRKKDSQDSLRQLEFGR